MIAIEKSLDFDLIYDVHSGPCLLYFWASWAPQCEQIKNVIEELSKDKNFQPVKFLTIEAEAIPQISSKFGITAVPTCVITVNRSVLETINGAHVPELVSKLRNAVKLAASSQKNVVEKLESKCSTGKDKSSKDLYALVSKCPVMLFMKGTPDEPRCGFSKQIVAILRELSVDFGHFDILEDEDVRQGLKTLFNWPTYPQLYVAGELQGGLDVIRELKDSGDLLTVLQSGLRKFLEKLVRKERVMLFMKGTPEHPRCGFSRQIVDILQKHVTSFGHFDVLDNETVREGLKAFSNWPTYPQVYVNGELLGGLDVIREMENDGELEAVFKSF